MKTIPEILYTLHAWRPAFDVALLLVVAALWVQFIRRGGRPSK